MVIQEYILHLINGEKVVATEDFDYEGEDTIVNQFAASIKDPTKCVRVGDFISGFEYVPWKNVVYVSTGDVREIQDWSKGKN